MSTIDRIKKLLTLADNAGATENEADTARRLAERLMEAAGISEAEVRDSLARGEDPAATVDVEIGMRVTRNRSAGILAVAVSRVVGCTVYRETSDGCLRWVGTADQRASAIELHGWLLRQLDLLVKSARRNAWATGRDRVWLNSYKVGVAHAIAEKARELRAAERAARPLDSVALIAQDRVQAAIKARLPKLRQSSRRARIGDASGYAAGQADGRTVQLRREVGVGRSRMLAAGGAS